MKRRTIAPALALLALVVCISVYVVVRAEGRPASACTLSSAASADRSARDTGGSGARIVVIGDSYSVGLGLERPLDSWPSRLVGQVHVAGFSGSGFAADPCETTSYADRAAGAIADGADLVVVEGGLNDVELSDAAITEGFDRLLSELRGLPVLVVGPPPAPARRELAVRVDRLLAVLSADAGVDYLTMIDLDLPYLDDDLHLTEAGHTVFGDRVAAAVSREVGSPATSPARSPATSR